MKVPKKYELQVLVPKFKLGKSLGTGGNAIVYAAKRGDEPVAVKFLLNTDPKRYLRFRDEVLVVTTVLKGCKWVIPIIEHHLPDDAGTEIPWYAMPVVTPLRKRLNEAPNQDVVYALAELAEGLADLHAKKVAHRDIKPENLFFFEDTFRFGDFGIAKFPDGAGLTTTTEPMGPLGYMAEEMMRNSASADPFKADVFSLAKTLWVLLTNQPYPFMGQYSRRGRYSLDELLPKDRFVHEPLDDLLEACTHSIPDKRLGAREFTQALRDVLAAQDDFELRNPLQWAGAEALASSVPCTRIEWTDPTQIVEVVKLLSRRDSLNHCFLPSGGGWDITDAELTEGGTAILLWHDERFASVVKPTRLTLERLHGGPKGSYATLESDALEPFNVKEKDEWREELLRCDEYNYMALPNDDDPWPKSVVHSSRYFKPGMFIIAPKGGIFNRVDDYEGKGNALGRDKLRTSFERALKGSNQERRAFALRRAVRLVTQVPVPISSFLSKLDLQTFQKLLELDKAMKDIRESRDTEEGIVIYSAADIESILSPDPERDAKRKEILRFLRALSAEQFGEAMALFLFGRGDIENPEDMSRIAAREAKNRSDLDYFVEKFGNGYFLKAVKRFGFEIVGTPLGE